MGTGKRNGCQGVIEGKDDKMKGFIVVFNSEDGKYCMVSDGTVRIEDLHGYKGIFIRETIYRSLELTLFCRLALWILGFNETKDAQDPSRIESLKKQEGG